MAERLFGELPVETVVLRMGGNVLTPRGTAAFDLDAVLLLTDFIRSLALRSCRVILLPGGAGGHLFIDLGRRLGCTDALMNDVGRTLIDMSSTILADHISRSLGRDGIDGCPKPAQSIQELQLFCRDFQVVVSSSNISGATTSDSLSLLIGDAFGAPILSIKQAIPFPDITRSPASGDDGVATVTVDDIEAFFARNGVVERAGWHPSLDAWSLRLLRRAGIQLHFTTLAGMRSYVLSGRIDPILKVAR